MVERRERMAGFGHLGKAHIIISRPKMFYGAEKTEIHSIRGHFHHGMGKMA